MCMCVYIYIYIEGATSEMVWWRRLTSRFAEATPAWARID